MPLKYVKGFGFNVEGVRVKYILWGGNENPLVGERVFMFFFYTL